MGRGGGGGEGRGSRPGGIYARLLSGHWADTTSGTHSNTQLGKPDIAAHNLVLFPQEELLGDGQVSLVQCFPRFKNERILILEELPEECGRYVHTKSLVHNVCLFVNP